MRLPIEDGMPLALIVQRLMDADLLPQDWGLALLAEIEASSRSTDGNSGRRNDSSHPPPLSALADLIPSDWSDALAVRAALDRARSFVHQHFAALSGDLAAGDSCD